MDTAQFAGMLLMLGILIGFLTFFFENDVPDYIVGIGILFTCLLMVIGLFLLDISFIQPSIVARQEQHIQDCMAAFEYTRAQCEYYAKYGGNPIGK